MSDLDPLVKTNKHVKKKTFKKMLLWLFIWRAISDSNRTRKHKHKSRQASARALGVLANLSFDPIYILRLQRHSFI